MQAAAAAAWSYMPWSAVSMGPRVRVLVTGSRAWSDAAAVRVALTRAWRDAGQPLTVVHGGCPTGADAIAAAWVREHEVAGIEEELHVARWHRHGRAAGPLRNQEMVDAGAWRVLAFPLGASPGTRHCVQAAEMAGLDVRLCEGE